MKRSSPASLEEGPSFKKTKQQATEEEKFVRDFEKIVIYCCKLNNKVSEDPHVITQDQLQEIVKRIHKSFFDLQEKYSHNENLKSIITPNLYEELNLENICNDTNSLLINAGEILNITIVDIGEEANNIEHFSVFDLPELEEEVIENVMENVIVDTNDVTLTEEVHLENNLQYVSSNEPSPLLFTTTNLNCYLCQKNIEKSPLMCKYCSNACHPQCCDINSILRGEDSMICNMCSTIETEGDPNFYSLIIKSKSGNIIRVNDINDQLAGLRIDKYKIKCPKCQELVTLKDLYIHSGRKFEFDNFSDYPFVPFSDEKKRAEISRVLIVFNLSKKVLINICNRYEKRIGPVQINEMYLNASYGNFSMHKAIFITLYSEKQGFMLAMFLNSYLIRHNDTGIDVHPVVYFWKSKAVKVVISSKHEMELVIPSQLDDFIERKWEVMEKESKSFFVVLKDVARCFFLMKIVHGLMLETNQIAQVKAIQNLATDKKTVLVLNIYYASIEEFKNFIQDQDSSFSFDWDFMVEEESYYMNDENIISIKFQSEEIAKSFVLDFNDSLFNEHHLQMFN